MTPTEQKDFLRGYADAEEKLLETKFDKDKALNKARGRYASTLEPYEQGYLMCLQEEHDRLNVLYANKPRRR
jgi:hypothetical protein